MVPLHYKKSLMLFQAVAVLHKSKLRLFKTTAFSVTLGISAPISCLFHTTIHTVSQSLQAVVTEPPNATLLRFLTTPLMSNWVRKGRQEVITLQAQWCDSVWLKYLSHSPLSTDTTRRDYHNGKNDPAIFFSHATPPHEKQALCDTAIQSSSLLTFCVLSSTLAQLFGRRP